MLQKRWWSVDTGISAFSPPQSTNTHTCIDTHTRALCRASCHSNLVMRSYEWVASRNMLRLLRRAAPVLPTNLLQSFQLQMNIKSKQFEWNDRKTVTKVLLNRQGWRSALENWVLFIWSQIVDDKASKDELVKCLDVSPSAELTYDIWMSAESKCF